MLDRSIGLGQPARAVMPDGDEAVREVRRILASEALQPLAKRLLDGRRQGLARDVGHFARELVHVFGS